MAEAFCTRELASALDDAKFPVDDCPKTINEGAARVGLSRSRNRAG
jgi:hypothetical protein